MQEALYYTSVEGGKVKCHLCPNKCVISEGSTGNCLVRRNIDGLLITESYGRLSSISIDPIEKKPLYHFFPGEEILSIGTLGCTFHCNFCQNHSISQSAYNHEGYYSYVKPEQLLKKAKENNCSMLAFTYNEPVVFYEYMLDVAKLFKKNNLKTVMVSNGYIEEEPLLALLPHIDAFNIDVKSYGEDFYKTLTGGKLSTVLNTIKKIIEHDKHLEITYLLIPGLNINEEKFEQLMMKISEFSKNVIIHISKYFPNYKLHIEATNELDVKIFCDIAKQYFPFTYAGNVSSNDNMHTSCPQCGELLISRSGYKSFKEAIIGNTCQRCGYNVPGKFDEL